MRTFALCIVGTLLAFFSNQAFSGEEANIDKIEQIAAQSSCAHTHWKDRGLARPAYFKGIALVFAKSICQPNRPDVKLVSAAMSPPTSHSERIDVLTWYDGIFSGLGMSNATAGADTLRHVYTLLLGLGMRRIERRILRGSRQIGEFQLCRHGRSWLVPNIVGRTQI